MIFVRTFRYLLFMLIIYPGSLFAGEGVIEVLSWFGLTIRESNTYLIGITCVFIALTPMVIQRITAQRKLKLYYPINNVNLHKYRSFFLSTIDKELNYLEDALQYLQSKGMHNESLAYIEMKENLIDVRQRIIANKELKTSDLLFMNKLFTRKMLLKNL